MRRLIVATCLIATICAFHIKKHDFDVFIESVEYKNIPSKYQLGKGAAIFPKGGLAPSIEILKKIAEDFQIHPTIEDAVTIWNHYADAFLVYFDYYIVHDGKDPLQVPDEHAGFNYTLITTYCGDLNLTRGWWYNIFTMKRGGDARLGDGELIVPITFADLQFTYDYSATIMGLGPKGSINGNVSDVVVEVKFVSNPYTLVISMEVYMTNSGHIDLNFSGNPLVDWLTNLLSEVITTLLEEVIVLVVEGIIRGHFEIGINDINDAINGFLNSTTPIPETNPAAVFLN